MQTKIKKNKKKSELEYYSLDRILKEEAQYNIIYGMRSNGKTFAVQDYGIDNYINYGEQMAIIRRYDMDFQGKRGQECFTHFVNNPKLGNIIEQKTKGEWTDIYYWSMRWYFCRYDDKGNRIKSPEPFCYAFSLAGQEHDKSTSYPNITTVLFDEFMTRQYYLPDEFVTFTNVLSTIIRERDNVKIFMCGNTVNKYNPYFKEMGLDNVLKMGQGDLQLYQFAAYGDTTLRVAVEYSDNPNKQGKPSDIYFAFNNPKLKMITNGLWELAIYPHLPYKYNREDIIGEYFVEWEEEIMHCEIISIDSDIFTYIHKKTTKIQNVNNDLVFTTKYSPKPNFRRKITHPMDDIGRKILWFFNNDKIFYQDNEVGEVMRNYMQWCKAERGFI